MRNSPRSRLPSIVVGVALAVTTPLHSPASQTPPAGDLVALRQSIESYLRPLDEAGELAGALLVAVDDTIVFEGAFGMASFELGVANTPATLFGAASVTKPITQIAFLAMVDEGLLSPDDLLARWIPSFPRGDEISLADLLRHRAGIPHRVTDQGDEAMPMTPADLVSKAAEADLLFAPGSDRAYSSAGYTVFARVLELVDGRPWEDIVAARVLAPAGMTQTVHPTGDRLVPRRAASYFRGADGPINAPPKHLSWLAGAGSLFTTPRDLFALQRHLLGGGFGDAARRELVRDGGLRWNGITNGYRTFADHHPASGVTVVFTGNYFTGAVDVVRRELPALAAGGAAVPPSIPSVEAVTVPQADREALAGSYRLGPGSLQPLRFAGEVARYGDWVLIPIARDRFWSPQDYTTVSVVRDDAGRVTALQWGEGGPTFGRE